MKSKYIEHRIRRNKPDLTRNKSSEKCVGAQLESLLKDIDKYNLIELKLKLVGIIEDPETIISKKKKYEYKNYMIKINSKLYMMEFIKNIYLASANLYV
jgi:uncharacterized membrane protein